MWPRTRRAAASTYAWASAMAVWTAESACARSPTMPSTLMAPQRGTSTSRLRACRLASLFTARSRLRKLVRRQRLFGGRWRRCPMGGLAVNNAMNIRLRDRILVSSDNEGANYLAVAIRRRRPPRPPAAATACGPQSRPACPGLALGPQAAAAAYEEVRSAHVLVFEQRLPITLPDLDYQVPCEADFRGAVDGGAVVLCHALSLELVRWRREGLGWRSLRNTFESMK